jgi:hypothetical protein
MDNLFSKFGGDRFGSNVYVNGTREFVTSNSTIARVAFVIIVLILFLFALRAGIAFIKWYFSDPSSPMLIRGIKNGNTYAVVSQSPKDGNDKLVTRSKDRKSGIEFTWSTWVFINSISTDNRYQHIFHKGPSNPQSEGEMKGANYPMNGPGLYIDKSSSDVTTLNNNLVVFMNTVPPTADGETILEKAVVSGVPLNKWLHVVIRMKGRNMDVYINGTIALRHVFRGVPKQNYGHVYSGMDKGFDGMMSDLQYFNYGLSIQEIMRINTAGPNMEMSSTTSIFPPYFSMKWYSNNDDYTAPTQE